MGGKINKNKDGSEFDDSENGVKRYKMDIEDNPEAEAKDQPRTIATKQKFLKLFPLCRLVVSLTCEETGIGQNTFYRWYDTDEEFAKAVDKARVHTNQMVRDLLMKKIVKEEDSPSIRYYLDRRHPEFKPTSKTEVVTGSRTLEDILKEDEQKTNESNTTITGGNDPKGESDSKGPEVPVGEVVQDQGQERETPAVPLKQDSSVLLEKENPPQSHSEGKTKGYLQNYRRRPASGLHSKGH